MKKTVFTGSGVAIVTPMNDDFSINYDKLGELIDFQIDNGTDCIVICGTTGESTTMTDDEHIECIRYAVEKTAGRVPVMAGAGSNDTRYSIWMSKEAAQAGADALLHVTPYYNKTTQAGLVRHFNMIADATDLPVFLYNVPGRTGLSISPATYKELSKHPNIVATKEASGNISAVAETKHLCGDDLDVYSGNDDQIIPLMSLGGKGVISVLANIMPQQTHDMCAAYAGGDLKRATAMQVELFGLINSLFLEVNPIPVKEALNLMGFNAGPCRMPLIELGAGAKKVLIEEMTKQKLL
ncbi:4-hydroxy-tetrahydrodipicolinate synthase [Oscillospiraceae bacterium MB08-C2-2]|nr:4-hydroxy-tetrahydrodipicolinate synthase [Oscillospiraceae bacterium MB08-C2-2]